MMSIGIRHSLCIRVVLAALLFCCAGGLISCGKSSSDNPAPADPTPPSTQINTGTGGTVELSDGTILTVLPSSMGEDVAVSFYKASDNTGTVENDRKILSPDYAAAVKMPSVSSMMATITVKIDKSLLPVGWDPGLLKPQVYNELTGKWSPMKALTYYDAEGGTLTFDLFFEAETPSAPAASAKALSAAASSDSELFRKFRVSYNLRSYGVTYACPQGTFTVKYIPPFPASADSVKPDILWDSKTGNATDENVPDFVEDTCAALNTAYTGFRLLKTSDNTDLFSDLSASQKTVYIADAGDALGESPIGGPMTIASLKIVTWFELRTTVAHEMAHVFQGQYFTAGTAGNVWNSLFKKNRWFLEASANYYAALVCSLTDTEKKEFYTDSTGSGYGDYLSVTLTEPSSHSMYSAAHFLDWTAHNYGQGVIAEGMKGTGSALSNLDTALAGIGGIPAVYAAYGWSILTDPDGYGGMNKALRTNTVITTSAIFKETTTYKGLSKQLPPLSMAYVEVMSRLTTDSMLVMSSEGAAGGSLVSRAYDFIGKTSADYVNVSELGGAGSYPWSKPLTVKHFGAGRAKNGVEQIIINKSMTDTAALKGSYYILQPPVVKSVQAGAVLFDTAAVGNIPRDYIKGYNIYKGKVDWLNENDMAPLPSSGTEQSYMNAKIAASDTLLVQVVDKYDNKWPKTGGVYGMIQLSTISFFSLVDSYVYSRDPFNDAYCNNSNSWTRVPGVLLGNTFKVYYDQTVYGTHEQEIGYTIEPCRRVTLDMRMERTAAKDAITSIELVNSDIAYGAFYRHPEYPTITIGNWQLSGAGTIPLMYFVEADGSRFSAELKGIRYVVRQYELNGTQVCEFLNSASYTWNYQGDLSFFGYPDETVNYDQCNSWSQLTVNIAEPL